MPLHSGLLAGTQLKALHGVKLRHVCLYTSCFMQKAASSLDASRAMCELY